MVGKEEENFIRIVLLLHEIAPKAVRVHFDWEFNPLRLVQTLRDWKYTLNKMKCERVINKTQWDILFPTNEIPKSTDFDVTLMVTLLKYLRKEPVAITEFDKQPALTDTTPLADIARIKCYRNDLAHYKNTNIDDVVFKDMWDNLSEAIKRLGGDELYQECSTLRTKLLGQSHSEIAKELHSTREVMWISIENLQKKCKSLQDDHNKLTKNVEMFKRYPMTSELEKWRTADKDFVPIKAVPIIMQCIKENNCVTITASSGVGKTATMRHVALKMENDGYEVLPVIELKDIVNHHNPKQKTLYVIDDFCGTFTINRTYLEKVKYVLNCVEALLKGNVRLIVACKLQVYRDPLFRILCLFKSCECNLLSENLRTSFSEKQSIATKHLKSNSSKITSYIDRYDCFPLLCETYGKCPMSKIEDFFQNPFIVFQSEINSLIFDGGRIKYCALALCVMFNNHLEENWLDGGIDDMKKRVFKNTFEACGLNRGTSKLEIKDGLDSLIGSLVTKENGVYKAIHDKIFDFMAFYFGEEMIKCLINNASVSFIKERFSLVDIENEDEFIIRVHSDQSAYYGRLMRDWSEGNIRDVFSNTNFRKAGFEQKILDHLETYDVNKQRTLADIKDGNTKTTVLMLCISNGYEHLTNWCIRHDVDLNCLSPDSMPISRAISYDYFAIMKMEFGLQSLVTPLFAACRGGHINIVKALLANKSDVNKLSDCGQSPLLTACDNCFEDIVSLLIKRGANIEHSNILGATPLFNACRRGHVGILSLLLNKGAVVNACMDGNVSPLFIACLNCHSECVDILLRNNAKIDTCVDAFQNSVSQFFYVVLVAVVRNDIDIVSDFCGLSSKDLSIFDHKFFDSDESENLENFDEIDYQLSLFLDSLSLDGCDQEALSNLLIQIHTICMDNIQQLKDFCLSMFENKQLTKELSKLLLNVCINVSINRKSSRHIFESEKHPELKEISCQIANGLASIYMHRSFEPIVKNVIFRAYYDDCSLLQISGDRVYNTVKSLSTNLRSNSSALYVACALGHIKIVKLLLDHNANVNIYLDDGSSAIHVACKFGHYEIVDMLIKAKSDVKKKMTNGLSPLSLACTSNHLDIVKRIIAEELDEDILNVSLMIANIEGHSQIVKFLLENIANPNGSDNNYTSFLLKACMHGHFETVKTLLHYTSDVNKCSLTGQNALFHACSIGNKMVVDLLLQNGADAAPRDEKIHFVFDYKDGYSETKKELTGFCDYFFTVPEQMQIVAACSKRQAHLFHNWQKQVGKVGIITTSPLVIACKKGHAEIVKSLLKSKTVDINYVDSQDISLLGHACINDHIDIVDILLNEGADVNRFTYQRISPLYISCHNGNLSAVNMLLQNGADINLSPTDGSCVIEVLYSRRSPCDNNQISNK